MSIAIGTNLIMLTEPCFSLHELNKQSPGSKGFHRYQVIRVIRNDRIAEYHRDMGLASSFSAIQFCIPGGIKDDTTGRIEILHTVEELQEIADEVRNEPIPQHETSYFDKSIV